MVNDYSLLKEASFQKTFTCHNIMVGEDLVRATHIKMVTIPIGKAAIGG